MDIKSSAADGASGKIAEAVEPASEVDGHVDEVLPAENSERLDEPEKSAAFRVLESLTCSGIRMTAGLK